MFERFDVKRSDESGLNPVRNSALHALKKNQSAEEDEDDGDTGDEKAERRSLAVAGERPTKTVNDAGHGIEAVQPAPARGNERAGIGDRRSEHPELQEKGHDVTHIAVERVERGEQEKERKKRVGQTGLDAIKERDAEKNDEADGEIHEAGDDGRERQNQAGKIDFGDHALIFNDDIGGVLEGVTEVRPGNERGEIENGIGQAFGGEFGETSEEKSEDGHGEQRLKNDPEDADGGLFVADFDVAPDEKIEEFAVGPEFREAEMEEAMRGFDARDDEMGVRRGGREGGRRRRRGDGNHQ